MRKGKYIHVLKYSKWKAHSCFHMPIIKNSVIKYYSGNNIFTNGTKISNEFATG